MVFMDKGRVRRVEELELAEPDQDGPETASGKMSLPYLFVEAIHLRRVRMGTIARAGNHCIRSARLRIRLGALPFVRGIRPECRLTSFHRLHTSA